MNFNMKFFNSSIKHIKGKEESLIKMKNNISVVKGEEFGFQILINGDDSFFCQLGRVNDIHWKGLNNKIRIDISTCEGDTDNLKMSFLGYVKDDEGNLVGDPIMDNKSILMESGHQMIWVEGRIPENYNRSSIKVRVKAFFSREYDKEMIISEKELDIRIIDYVLKPVKQGEFYLDLWQHLCNWARVYDVEYFSDEHFYIIENYIKDLGNLGQRVIDLIVSDYPWAGQRCYEVYTNPSNLYEMNIVKVFKNREGSIYCDFTAMDRYIDICFSQGIKEEINLFGLIGNWDAFAFGSPIKEYRDAMRIIFYDEKEESFDYIKSKEELKEYLTLLFKHLINRGLWDRVKVISDEPNNAEVFKECCDFIQSAVPEYTISYKCAIHHQDFFENHGDKIQSLSLNTCELVNNILSMDNLIGKIKEKGGKLTWYSCCFPEKLNIFLKSPLIESRLIGWFTYYFNLDGFLRWAYGIWPNNVLEDASYKYPRWAAGDMFFVYPGKNLKPMHSVRLKNLIFGIQDFNIFKELEKKSEFREEIIKELKVLLGNKEDMRFVPERSVEMDYSLDYEKYMDLRNTLVRKYLS